MSATPEEVSAATNVEAPPTPEGSEETPQAAESAPAVKDADEKGKNDGFTRRIDELTRDFRTTERELAAERRERQALQERLERLTPKPEPVEVSTRTLADFGYDEPKYQQYLFGEAQTRAVRAAEGKLKEAQDLATRQSREAQFAERGQEYAKNFADYDEVALRDPRDGGPNITEAMAETIMDSENGPAIAYHLGKNPRLAAQISRLPPLQQAREIGRIEAKIGEKPVAPKVSKAPEPASKIDASDASITPKPDTADGEKLSDADWLKARNKQVARRRS